MIIERVKSIGTASGILHHREDVAWVEWWSDGERCGDPLVATLVSIATHEPLSDIYVDSFAVYDNYSGDYLGQADDWAGAVKLALGKPPAGHWYQIKGHAWNYVPKQAR